MEEENVEEKIHEHSNSYFKFYSDLKELFRALTVTWTGHPRVPDPPRRPGNLNAAVTSDQREDVKSVQGT